MTRVRLPHLLVSLFVGLVVLLVPAAPANAHAALVGSTPAAGDVIGTFPAEVSLVFNEPVTPIAGRIQVLAPDGKRISESVTSAGTTIRIKLRRADQPLGTYLVSYRIVSGDSHPIGNALIFSVGAPSARPAETDPTSVHGSVTAAVPAIKFLGYAGLTLAIGPALFLALLWPRRLSRRGPIRLVRAGLVLIGLATCGALWTQAPYGSGAPLWDVSPAELAGVLASPFGGTLGARLAVLAAIAALLPAVLRGTAGRGRALTVLVLAAGGLTTWPLTGHSIVSPLPGVVVAADVVHLAAMAAWLGGLATLAVFLLRRAHPRVLGVLLPAWSRWAALAVVWLVAAGVVQAVVQVGSIGALWQTGYGRLLTVKVAILAAVLSAAAYARALVRRAHRPARLRGLVGTEIAGTAVILAFSAVLVQVTPGRAARPDTAERVDDGFSQTLTSKLYTVQFNIYPVELGEWNTVHGLTYTPEGRQLQAAEWTVTTRYLDRSLEAVSEPMMPLPGRNDALGSVTFPLPGRYEVSFTIRTTDVDRATVRTTVTVPAAPDR
jgi:copper transport protein